MYYINDVTGETSFEAPGQELAVLDHAGSLYSQQTSAPGSDWTKHFDEEFQAEYWYNTATGEASYEEPPGLLAGPESAY